MPTNPNWLEHTERAAWDTVKTLRKQIAEERERMARLAPVGQSWHRIVERLDAAKAEHSIDADHYADIVDGLDEALRRLKAECESLSRTVSDQEKRLREAALRVEVVPLAATAPATADDDADGHWFFERVGKAARTTPGGSPRKKAKVENLLARAEMALEQLEEAPRDQVVDWAVELAALALRIAERTRRPRPRSDD